MEADCWHKRGSILPTQKPKFAEKIDLRGYCLSTFGPLKNLEDRNFSVGSPCMKSLCICLNNLLPQR